MPNYKDQLHSTIELPHPPKRIISLVPSQTELLYTLGLGERVVGITKFCIHPEEWYRQKTRVGGTKNVNFERIEALQPDFIIGNKEENSRADIEQLQQNYPVWMSDISTLEEAYAMIEQLGGILDVQQNAQTLIQQIKREIQDIQNSPPSNKRVAYFIWRDPWMTIGKDTFIHHMLELAGWVNVYEDKTRYPMTDLEQLAALQPEVVLLSSEPYPFKAKHQAEIAQVCPQAQIELVDGEVFSWYGSRLLHTANYIKNLQKKLEH